MPNPLLYGGKMPEKQIKSWIKPEVLSQPAYHVESPQHRIKLNQNECPWDWPEELKRKIVERLLSVSWNRYPGLVPEKLKDKLSEIVRVAPNQIVVGKGSNEVLQALATVILRPGDTVCTLAPTFAVYRLLSEQRSAKIVESFLDERFRVDTKDLLEKSRQSRMTILCNPNSPTGTLLPLGLIEEVARESTGVVILDEAYVDFSGVSALPLLESYPNLIITRTFSKAFALAGFRIGYAVMAETLAHEVQKGLLPFNIDLPSLIATEIILENRTLVQGRVKQIIRGRDQLISRLNTLDGVTAWLSHANFFLLETPQGPKKTFEFLLSRGILVRDVSGYLRCENMLRVTVGSPEENKILYQAIKDLT